MTRLVLIFLAYVLFMSSVSAQVEISNQVAQEVGRAIGFFRAQSATLKKLVKDHPDLKREAMLAELSFEVKFGAAAKNMDERMVVLGADKWARIKEESLNDPRVQSVIGSTLSKEEATQFIQEVLGRSEGQVPSPILETFLLFDPRYEKSPVVELIDGYRQVYESNGSGKARGIKFRLDFPKTWEIKPGKRPHVLAMGVSEMGRGLETFIMSVQEIDLEGLGLMTAKDVDELLESGVIRESLPENSVYIDSGSMLIEQLPGFWIRSDMLMERGRSSRTLSTLKYVIFYNDRRLELLAMVGPSGSEKADAPARFKKYEPLFDQILNTLIFPEVWRR